jgi:site-specific DNA-methyltransferase (adenine-specific)
MIEPVIIGDCTLYQGDCLELLPTLAPVDMIFTDPPYGHNNNNGDLISRREAALGKFSDDAAPRPILNDGPEANDLVRKFFAMAPRLLARGGCCCCCCGGGGPDPQFARWSLWLDEVLDFKQMIIWDKGPMGMGWHYRRSYETVLVAQKPGAACKWHDTSDRIENIIRPGHLGMKKQIPSEDAHPTPKPIELAQHFIRLHTLPGETVLDPFMGGGSTAVACVRDGRKFIGVELDPQWFDYSCRRVEDAYKQGDLFRVEPAKPAAKMAPTLFDATEAAD